MKKQKVFISVGTTAVLITHRLCLRLRRQPEVRPQMEFSSLAVILECLFYFWLPMSETV